MAGVVGVPPGPGGRLGPVGDSDALAVGDTVYSNAFDDRSIFYRGKVIKNNKGGVYAVMVCFDDGSEVVMRKPLLTWTLPLGAQLYVHQDSDGGDGGSDSDSDDMTLAELVAAKNSAAKGTVAGGGKSSAGSPPRTDTDLPRAFTDDKTGEKDGGEESEDVTENVPRPPTTVTVGDLVDAQYGTHADELWFPGRITVVSDSVNGTCDVEYDDGETETGKPFARIRLKGAENGKAGNGKERATATEEGEEEASEEESGGAGGEESDEEDEEEDEEDEEDSGSSFDEDENEDEEEDGDDDGDDEEFRQNTYGTKSPGSKPRPPKSKAPRKQKLPPAYLKEAVMDEADMPVSPGGGPVDPDEAKGGDEGGGPSGGGKGLSGPKLVSVKQTIGKILELGLKAGTPEAEAQQAMRQAQRLLKKHNLTQAAIMRERSGAVKDEGTLKGGMVKVTMRMARTKKPIKMDRWMDRLMSVVADNFEVKCFFQTTKRHKSWGGSQYSSPTTMTFYGMLVNSQLAAYAFTVAFARVFTLSRAYRPPAGEFESKKNSYWNNTSIKSKAAYTANARRNYLDGLVSGLRSAVSQAQSERRRRREEKVRRYEKRKAKVAKMQKARDDKANPTEEDLELDEIDDDDDEDSCGENVDKDHDDDTDDELPLSFVKEGDWELARLRTKLDRRIKQMTLKIERSEQVKGDESALVLHTATFDTGWLKAKHGIKLSAGRKRKALAEFHGGAFDRGRDDAKQIDLNRRAIEEGAKRRKE